MTIVLSVMNLLIILLWSRVLIWTERVQFLLSLSSVVFALSASLYSVYVYWDSLGQQWLSFGVARNLKILIKRCQGLLDLQVWGFKCLLGCDEWESHLCASARIKMSYFAVPSPSYRGSTVVKVLCYKSEGRLFDPSWCHWNSSWHKILPIALWPWGRLSL